MMTGRWKWLGANQVWLGCPQPFCFMAEMDAAVASVRTMMIARGRQICIFSIDKSKTLPPVSTDCYEDDIAFYDFGLFFDSSMYLVKGKRHKKFRNNGILHEDQTIENELRAIYDDVKYTTIDAAIANEFVAILYKGDKAITYKLTNITIDKQITTMPIKYLDAAVYLRQQQIAYVFKGPLAYVGHFADIDEK
ncbi:hypothetical protein B4U80_12289, partial [Leptotrombidium deliense]